MLLFDSTESSKCFLGFFTGSLFTRKNLVFHIYIFSIAWLKTYTLLVFSACSSNQKALEQTVVTISKCVIHCAPVSGFRLWQSFSRRGGAWTCSAVRWWIWSWQSSDSRLRSTITWALLIGDSQKQTEMWRCRDTTMQSKPGECVCVCLFAGWSWSSFNLWGQRSERNCRSSNSSWKTDWSWRTARSTE